jgi:hypothetical protein
MLTLQAFTWPIYIHYNTIQVISLRGAPEWNIQLHHGYRQFTRMDVTWVIAWWIVCVGVWVCASACYDYEYDFSLSHLSQCDFNDHQSSILRRRRGSSTQRRDDTPLWHQLERWPPYFVGHIWTYKPSLGCQIQKCRCYYTSQSTDPQLLFDRDRHYHSWLHATTRLLSVFTLRICFSINHNL